MFVGARGLIRRRTNKAQLQKCASERSDFGYMTTTILALEESRAFTLARVADYATLCKPRIAVLVLVAVAVAFCVASWGQPNPVALIHALVGTLFVASSASALNQWIERKRDELMTRTASRPLPAGRLSPVEAFAFGGFALAIGLCYLVAFVGLASAAWGAMTWVLYVCVYTPAKTRTSMNTAIGAVAGAMPVMIGWSAAQGAYDVRAAALFLLLFLWQFPHFMAIAWLYREQYARAGMKMLPVIEPTGARAGVQAVWAALALVPVSIIPALFTPGDGAAVYAVVALILGLAQLALAIQFCAWRDNHSARQLLRASLVYLPSVLLLLTFISWF
jgi:protoheme IX farnesyltransferase